MTKKLFKSLAATAVLASVVTPLAASASDVAVSNVKEGVDYSFTTGTGMDSYFSAWVTNVDVVTKENGEQVAHVTFAGHSFAVVGFAVNGEEATIVSSTGSAATKDLVRVVELPLDKDGNGTFDLDGGERGSYTFVFDIETAEPTVELEVAKDVDFVLETGSGQDDYFKTWVPAADIVVNENGEKFAHITFAGHSFAIASFQVNGEEATIVSSTGSAATKDLVRVVVLPLDENNKGALDLDGGERGTYTFNFDFTPKAGEAPTFVDTLTEQFQKVELTITGMPAQFIIPAGIKNVQAKNTEDGIEFLVQTQDGKSERGHIETIYFKKGGEVVSEASATAGEVAQFTVDSIEGLTIQAAFVDAAGKETTYEGPVAEAVVVEEKPEVEKVDPAEFVNGSDLDESVFGEEAQKVKFTYDSLVSSIPSAMAFDVMVPEATVQQVGDEYEVTLHMKPQRTKQVIVAQQGATVAESAVEGTEPMEVKFTIGNLDDLFFYVDGVSGSGTETLIGVEVTGFEFLTKEPTVAFTDVAEFVEEIDALYHAGITKGTGNGEFKPNAGITRAEFAVMIARALDVQPAQETAFADVKGQWFEKEVQALKEIGIINGISATTFAPNEFVTREQAATMIFNMLVHEGYKVTASADSLNFTDADKVSAYAKQALAELQATEIMVGSNGAVDPAGNLTRGHMAKVLKRSLDLVNYEF